MPYQWIPPALFVEYEGVAVYYTYRDHDTVSGYWYTTDPADCDYNFSTAEGQFDVRDLPNPGHLDINDADNHISIIQHAIRVGLLSGEPATPGPLSLVKIKIRDGVAYVIEKPPQIKVEIIDHDVVEPIIRR